MYPWPFYSLWFACGICSWGMTFAYYQRAWPELAAADYWKDLIVSVFEGLLGGPAGMLCVWLFSIHGYQGMQWW